MVRFAPHVLYLSNATPLFLVRERIPPSDEYGLADQYRLVEASVPDSVDDAEAPAPLGDADASDPAPFSDALAPDPDPFDDADALEDLEEEIAILAAHIHAATHRLLTLIAEFDRRRGWELGGHRTCAHWLHARTGIDLGAARECTTAQLERMVRAFRRGTREDEAALEKRRHEMRTFSVFPGEDGMYVVKGRLSAEVGALLMRAVEPEGKTNRGSREAFSRKRMLQRPGRDDAHGLLEPVQKLEASEGREVVEGDGVEM